MSNKKLPPEEIIENIYDAFDEASCRDEEEARTIIKEAGFDPDEEVQKGLEFVNSLNGKVKLILADQKRKQVSQLLKEKFSQIQKSVVENPKAKLLTILKQKNKPALVTYFRKIESLNDDDALEMLNEEQQLELLDIIENELADNPS